METIRYRIEYEPGIEKKLDKFPKKIKEIIKKNLEKKLMTDPVAFGKPLKHTLKGLRSLRIGDYRIVYKIIDDKVVVLIIDIDHRKDVYEKY